MNLGTNMLQGMQLGNQFEMNEFNKQYKMQQLELQQSQLEQSKRTHQLKMEEWNRKLESYQRDDDLQNLKDSLYRKARDGDIDFNDPADIADLNRAGINPDELKTDAQEAEEQASEDQRKMDLAVEQAVAVNKATKEPKAYSPVMGVTPDGNKVSLNKNKPGEIEKFLKENPGSQVVSASVQAASTGDLIGFSKKEKEEASESALNIPSLEGMVSSAYNFVETNPGAVGIGEKIGGIAKTPAALLSWMSGNDGEGIGDALSGWIRDWANVPESDEWRRTAEIIKTEFITPITKEESRFSDKDMERVNTVTGLLDSSDPEDILRGLTILQTHVINVEKLRSSIKSDLVNRQQALDALETQMRNNLITKDGAKFMFDVIMETKPE